ncbi:MAG: TIGR00269 family protein [Candidatus Woesearchaeota archaeon]
MACKRCLEKPIFRITSGERLCKSCFIKYFEKKARKTISKYGMVGEGDRIAVAISGGKDSLAVLGILDDMNSRQSFKLFAILIDEGIKGYRPSTLKDAKAFCRKRKIPLHVISFKKELGITLDTMVKKAGKDKACGVCGIFRRYLLNKAARKLKANKLFTGHNLDDETQSIMMNQFRQNVATSARLGPVTGVRADERFIRRYKPFYLLSEKEVAAYAFEKKMLGRFIECPYAFSSYRGEVRDMLNEIESRHPGSKASVIKSFLEILPLLKEKYAAQDARIKSCEKCREPCSQDVCMACKTLKLLKN